MRHCFSLNMRQRVGLWIRRPWFDSQRSQFTACGHSDGKGATDVCGRPGASVGVRRRNSSQQVTLLKLDTCPFTEQAEMSLNVTLTHNTTKF